MHFISRYFFYLLILSLTFSSQSCFQIPDDFVLPEWDVELNVPFFNKKFTIADIVRDQRYISSEGTSVEDSLFLIESDLFRFNTGLAEHITLASFSSLQNSPLLIQGSTNTTVYLEFSEGAVIDSAVFQSGTFSFTVNNPSAENVLVNFLIPGLRLPSGIPVLIEMTIPSSSEETISYDLADHHYRMPPNQPPEFHNRLAVDISASTENGSSATVFVDFTSSDFMFKMISGILPEGSLGIQRQAFKFVSDRVLDFRDNIFLREASMRLTAEFSTIYNDPFPLELRQFNIIGKRNDGNLFYLEDSTGSAELLIRLNDGYFEGYFDETNSNITELISFLPDSIILIGDYILNPDSERGTVTIEDSVEVEDIYSALSVFALKRSNINDSSKIDVSESDRVDVANSKSLSLFLEVDNAIPLSTWLKVDFVDRNYNHLLTITKNSNGTDSIYIQAADVDEFGEVVGPYHNPPVVLQLDASRIDLLSRAEYALYSVYINTEDAYINPPEYVAVRPASWLNIRAYGRLEYHVNPDDL